MKSIKQIQENIVTISRSVWLVSLGAIVTAGEESKQIVGKVTQWRSEQSSGELTKKYNQVMANIKEKMGMFLAQMRVPNFSMNA